MIESMASAIESKSASRKRIRLYASFTFQVDYRLPLDSSQS